MNEVRKYFIKESWIFNLESMHDKLYCIMYDLEDGKLQFPLKIAGTMINNYDDIYNLINECDDYQFIAHSRKVTSREYGRIKQLVSWRVEQRYFSCMSNGMEEREAGKCFSDL